MITRYEIAAKHPDGRAFLVAYTPRVSRPGLRDAMVQRGAAIIEKCGIGETEELVWITKPRIHCGIGDWYIGFTGRTQLEAKSSGSLPYIAA